MRLLVAFEMSKVKRFVKTEGEADAYEGVTINYISGKKPEFVVFDDGQEAMAF